jgi:hypothetical protein
MGAEMTNYVGSEISAVDNPWKDNFRLEDIIGVWNPEEWIALRRRNQETPIALLIMDIQKQAIGAYRKMVGHDKT